MQTTTTAATPTPSVWAATFTHLALVGAAALVSGLLVGGVAGRVFMRVAAVIAPDQAAVTACSPSPSRSAPVRRRLTSNRFSEKETLP
ncbi:MAG: hypothetical protein ACR2QE_12355 [Acidimicrobiales bacterium]